MLTRARVFCFLVVVAILASASPATAQDELPALRKPIAKGDSIAGRWEYVGGGGYGGARHIKMSITQNGDSLQARVTIEVGSSVSERDWELVGTIRGGKIDLKSRFVDGLRMAGVLRRDVLRLRIVPGQYEEADAWEAQFRPAP